MALTARELIEALLFFPMEEEVDVLVGVPDDQGLGEVSIYGRGAHVDVGRFDIPVTAPAACLPGGRRGTSPRFCRLAPAESVTLR